jgi:hypothetical protein
MSNTIEKIKDLQLQIEKLQSKAKEEAIDKLKAIESELSIIPADSLLSVLRAAGHYFEIAGVGKSGKKKSAGRGQQKPGTECPDCKFATDPPHNGRQHRSQGKGKHKPFTGAELTKLGLKKV